MTAYAITVSDNNRKGKLLATSLAVRVALLMIDGSESHRFDTIAL